MRTFKHAVVSGKSHEGVPAAPPLRRRNKANLQTGHRSGVAWQPDKEGATHLPGACPVPRMDNESATAAAAAAAAGFATPCLPWPSARLIGLPALTRRGATPAPPRRQQPTKPPTKPPATRNSAAVAQPRRRRNMSHEHRTGRVDARGYIYSTAPRGGWRRKEHTADTYVNSVVRRRDILLFGCSCDNVSYA